MAEYTKQHFVPSSYLKRFSNDDIICVFDKIENKKYDSNINDVAQERDFYDLLDNEFRKYLEKKFQKYEDMFSRTINELILKLLNVNEPFIELEMRKKFSFYLTMQFKRSREARNDIAKVDTNTLQLITDIAIKKKFPECKKFPIYKPAFERIKILHLCDILDNDSTKKIYNIFCNFIFLIGDASNLALITSDNPLVKQLNSDNDSECMGIDSVGVEFLIPLNEKYILILKERSFYKAEYGKFENNMIRLNSDEVKIYNELQIKQSTRQIFSKNKEIIDNVADFCENNPDKLHNKEKKFESVYQTIDGKDYLISKQKNIK